MPQLLNSLFLKKKKKFWVQNIFNIDKYFVT